MTNAAVRRAKELWETTPLDSQPIYVAFRRLRFPSGRVVRKYLGVGGRVGTEDRYKAWKTTSLDEAKRAAARIDGHFAEFRR